MKAGEKSLFSKGFGWEGAKKTLALPARKTVPWS